MSDQDIRWKQRLASYEKALKRLSDAVALAEERELSELEIQGLIKGFEYTQELAWQVMKDYFLWQGNPDIRGSRDAVREAFKTGLITDGDTWMDMIKSRNLSSQSFQEDIASVNAEKINSQYFHAFCAFRDTMSSLKKPHENA